MLLIFVCLPITNFADISYCPLNAGDTWTYHRVQEASPWGGGEAYDDSVIYAIIDTSYKSDSLTINFSTYSTQDTISDTLKYIIVNNISNFRSQGQGSIFLPVYALGETASTCNKIFYNAESLYLCTYNNNPLCQAETINQLEHYGLYQYYLMSSCPGPGPFTLNLISFNGTKITVDVESIKDKETSKETCPNVLKLDQNTPNPFNSTTNIIYNTGNNLFGTICIFNVSGRLVHLEQVMGRGSITWNAGKNPSGIYVCKLNIGKQAQSIKMMLMK